MPDLMWRDWQTSPPPKGVRIVCERRAPYHRFTIDDVRTVDPKLNVAGLTWRPAHDGDPH
jgi:hypothetical protein